MPSREGQAAAVAELLERDDDQAEAETLEGQGWLLDTVPPAPVRGPGRPKGARNRSSRDLLAAVQALGADPAMALVRMYSQNTKELARTLGAEPLDVLRLQMQAATNVLPYVRSKAPLDLQVRSENLTLILHDIVPDDPEAGLAGAKSGNGPLLELLPSESEQNQ